MSFLDKLNVIDILLLISLICIWTDVITRSHEFYSTAKFNRYKFRYWFAVGSLNIFHICLAFIYRITGNVVYQDARWITFLIINVLLFEIFVTSVKNRHLELYARVTYYILLVMEAISDKSYLLPILTITLLILVAQQCEHKVIAEHFRKTFYIYYLVYLVPLFVNEYTTTLSLTVGVIYSFHVMMGVRKLYDIEKVDEIIIDKMVEEELTDDINHITRRIR